MDLGLAGKVAVVAGASRGIGLAIAAALAREGADVLLAARSTEGLMAAADTVRERAPRARLRTVQEDMTDPQGIRRALRDAVDAWGGIDAVVGNVGSGAVRSGWDVGLDDWESTLRINLLGGMALAREAIPQLQARGGGSLTFISSIAGCEAIGAPLTYAAAKAALQSAVKSLSRVAGMHRVRVNAVAPGNILFPGGTWERKLAERREFFDQYVRAEVPLQRFGTPEEIADVVAFLASDRASFITGACVVVDGGQTRST